MLKKNYLVEEDFEELKVSRSILFDFSLNLHHKKYTNIERHLKRTLVAPYFWIKKTT